MVDISIIIVSWNASALLRGCLRSIANQPQPPTREVIVVDNASSDSSADMVEREFPDVALIRSRTNRGFAGGNNLGISAARGKYLFFVNSDVDVLDGALERLHAFLEANPAVGLAGPLILSPDGTVQRSCMGAATVANTLFRAFGLDRAFPRSATFGSQLMTCWNHDQPGEVDVVNGCFWAARRTAVDAVGGLDERFFMYGEDVDWCMRFRRAGWKVMFEPGARVIHHGKGSSSNAPVKYYVQLYRAKLQLWRKYHGPASTLIIRLILVFHHAARLALNMAASLVRRDARAHFTAQAAKNRACVCWLIGARAPGQRTGSP